MFVVSDLMDQNFKNSFFAFHTRNNNSQLIKTNLCLHVYISRDPLSTVIFNIKRTVSIIVVLFTT